MKTARALAFSLFAGPAAAAAQIDLPPTARLSAERQSAADSHAIAVSPWRDGRLEVLVTEGAVRQEAYILPATSLTTLQLIAPLRDSLQARGYRILFECADTDCGGFDFRYALDLLPEPDMHVDLGDYRYVAAERAEERIALVASRSATAGYLHITEITPAAAAPDGPTVADGAETPTPLPGTIGPALNASGRAVLDGLVFRTGSALLDDVAFPALLELANYLRASPATKVVLVGHTDAVGTLEANTALSRRRAQAVVDRLTTAHGIAPNRLSAEGVGYLVPRALNTTSEGRALNRRVEVVRVN
ncbi:MAG: OmpA family protein [Pseudomonadota bacterium]